MCTVCVRMYEKKLDILVCVVCTVGEYVRDVRLHDMCTMYSMYMLGATSTGWM